MLTASDLDGLRDTLMRRKPSKMSRTPPGNQKTFPQTHAICKCGARTSCDGYLSDCAALTMVLHTVRLMREKLLQVHRDTEESLITDATAHKGVIEGVIADIDDLHAEVERKKGISTTTRLLPTSFGTTLARSSTRSCKPSPTSGASRRGTLPPVPTRWPTCGT